ncbi:MAG TPA: biotin/lipoyl-binding protein, partial [Rubrivivax sp.]|nr:biotin/lipoyl-binding protein [Rubrivivax sp.]
MRRRLIVLPAVVLALLAVAAVAWWRHAPAVPALEVRAAPLVRSLQFSGRVATASRVDLGSTVTGRVAQVLVEEGARVHRGDVLVQLDADELRAALAQ